MTDVGFLSAAELGRRYRDGSLSPVTVTATLLDRIAAAEPRLNAVALLLVDSAMAQARAAERELRAGHDRGALHGVPVAVKDLFAVAGVPTRFGSHADFAEIPGSDAAVVARLHAAGAVMLAKTNLLEFAYGAVHPDIGQTNNPHDPTRTSGGSSGGSAALVAAGLCCAAVGTDTGGSIRIPAAYCGIVGLKPTFGVVDIEGGLPLSWSLDHAGPMARTPADARAMLAALTGQRAGRGPVPLRGLRVGVLAAHRDDPCISDDVRRGFAESCARLIDAGAMLRDIQLPSLAHASTAVMLILLPEALAIHKDRLDAMPDRFAAATRAQLDAGAAIPALAYLRARQVRTRLRDEFAAMLRMVDLVISPTVPYEAPAEDPPLNQAGASDEMLCCAPANLVGVPALSLPCGLSGVGLPLGLHMAAAWGRDDWLLAVAEAVAALPEWPNCQLDPANTDWTECRPM